MALVSPGVKVTVVDQSNYVSTQVGTVPFVLIVTAQDKASGTTADIAQGTTQANANKVYLMTSQYDLLTTFGTPTFYENGSEINEYGLLAAYSALGQSSLCYVQRADIDLNAIAGSLYRPAGVPQDGSLYLDVTNSRFGFNVWDAATNTFTYTPATIITDPNLLQGNGTPISGYGAGGDIAINGLDSQLTAYQKMVVNVQGATAQSTLASFNGQWQKIGTTNWQQMIPSIVSPYAAANVWGGSTYNVIPSGFSIGIGSIASNTTGWVSAINSFPDPAAVGYNTDQATGNVYMVVYYGVQNPAQGGSTATLSWQYVAGSGSPNTVPESYGFKLTNNAYNTPVFQPGPNYTYPAWNSVSPDQHANLTFMLDSLSSPSGSIWQNTSPDPNGALLIFQRWSASLGQFVNEEANFYYNDVEANYKLDPTGGGLNIPVDTKYVAYDIYDLVGAPSFPPSSATGVAKQGNLRNTSQQPNRYAQHQVFVRYATGITQITGSVTNPVFPAATFTVSATEAGSSTIVNGIGTATLVLNDTAQRFVDVFATVAPPNVVASVNAKGQVVIKHLQGGTVYIFTNNTALFTNCGLDNGVGIRNYPAITASGGGVSQQAYGTFSNWTQATYGYIVNGQVGGVSAENGTLWYWNDPTQADIMIQNNGQWCGYRTVTNSVRGENLTLTDPNGPIFSATPPLTQSTGSALVAGDLWIDVSDLDNYPVLYRWTQSRTFGVLSWQLVDLTNKYNSGGVLFADARWANSGAIDPATGPIVPISTLLTSSYTDLDAPNPALSPQGVLLWNTRRSSYNVKQLNTQYFTSQNFPGQSLPANADTWVSVSGNKPNGVAYMGRQAQRGMIIQALRKGVDDNIQLREDSKNFTLLVCPQYPELAPNLVALNNERDNTGFVLIDTPLRLDPHDIVTWATNNEGLGLSTGDGLLVGDPYSAAWYPSCQTNDLTGNTVVTCATHMILRTILSSDYQSYPWFAPAGAQRGKVDNAIQLGYLQSGTTTFVPLSVNQGLRDVLYTNRIDPLTFIPGNGILNYGNKTTTGITSALDRINVARLVAYMRGRIKSIAVQYLFEPNDQITRNSIVNALNGLMIDLIAKRALYDYLIVCDHSNNTPDRIDRNELWVDIAIEPVKAVEFIYIPIRLKNTGSIAQGL